MSEETAVKTETSSNGHAADEIEVLFTRRKPKRVYVEDADNGARFLAEVREMSDEDYSSYLKENAKKIKYVNGQPVRHNFEGTAASLICRCLYYADGPNQGKKVPKAMIQGWGTAIQQKLSVLCVKVNGLDPGAEDAEGKD